MTPTTAPVFVSIADADIETIHNKFGEDRTKTSYIEGKDKPQAFLVTSPSNSVVRPHFHPVDQFQLIFGGHSVSYGRTPIRDGHVLVHYTDANTPYGPYGVCEGVLEFFTLRPRFDDVIHYMPEGRNAPRPGRVHRNIHLGVNLQGDSGGPGTHTIFDSADDSAAAYRVCAEPGELLRLPSTAWSAGCYLCVLNGAVVYEGIPYGPRSLAWLPPGPPAPVLRAAEGSGVDLLYLRFPAPCTQVST
jgi:hypothetical protein